MNLNCFRNQNLLFGFPNGLLLNIQIDMKLQWIQIQDVCTSPMGFSQYFEWCFHLFVFFLMSLLQRSSQFCIHVYGCCPTNRSFYLSKAFAKVFREQVSWRPFRTWWTSGNEIRGFKFILFICKLFRVTSLKWNPWWLFSKKLALYSLSICCLQLVELKQKTSPISTSASSTKLRQDRAEKLTRSLMRSSMQYLSKGIDWFFKSSTKQFNKEACAAWGCTTGLLLKGYEAFLENSKIYLHVVAHPL